MSGAGWWPWFRGAPRPPCRGDRSRSRAAVLAIALIATKGIVYAKSACQFGGTGGGAVRRRPLAEGGGPGAAGGRKFLLAQVGQWPVLPVNNLTSLARQGPKTRLLGPPTGRNGTGRTSPRDMRCPREGGKLGAHNNCWLRLTCCFSTREKDTSLLDMNVNRSVFKMVRSIRQTKGRHSARTCAYLVIGLSIENLVDRYTLPKTGRNKP